jgi:hypothetical protein
MEAIKINSTAPIRRLLEAGLFVWVGIPAKDIVSAQLRSSPAFCWAQVL